MKRRKRGFTLAEVLIALAVIGIIAGLTVPSLIQRTNKQEYVSALQKTYSVLSQVTNLIIAEEGSPGGSEGWAETPENIYKLYKKHLNTAKECGLDAGCTQNGAVKSVKRLNKNGTDNFAHYYSKLILADGVQVFFYTYSNYADCNKESSSNDICGRIHVDVNGEKGPNITGRDYFWFAIRKNGLYPWGCESGDSDDCTSNGNGYSCACKILREGAMNY